MLKKAPRLLLFSLFFYFACIAFFSFYKYQKTAKEKEFEIDDYIYKIVVSLPYYLENKGIDKLINGKMTDAEYERLVFEVSDLGRIWGVNFIYQMRIVDDEIYNVFTSGSDVELENKTYQKYNEKYPDRIEGMLSAAKELKVKYDSDSDNWGSFRSIYMPVLQKNGEYHILGVDYSLKKVDEILYTEAITSFVYGFFVLLFSFPFLFISYIGLQQVVSELDKNFKNLSDLTSEYKQLSLIDQATQIPNRRSFLESARRKISRLKREDGNLFVAILDLDHFKNVNDTYGHNNGDIVLVSFARLIEDSMRLEDTWGRWGGEEFVIMFPGKNIDSAKVVLERIRSLSENNEVVLLDGKKISVTVSAGVAYVDMDYDSNSLQTDATKIVLDAIERADKQLYIAKETGRNKVCYEKI